MEERAKHLPGAGLSLRSYPFGYPTFSEQDAEGYQVVTYPPHLTSQIVTIVDSSEDNVEDEKAVKKLKPAETNEAWICWEDILLCYICVS
jgi:hypothetical protein